MPSGDDIGGGGRMAQASRVPVLGARLRRMARRYGFTGGKAATALLVTVLAFLGIAGALLSAGPAGVELSRAADAEQPVSGDSTNAVAAEEGAAKTSSVVVHVDGAVAAPGVYELAEGARVNDAVAAAGGLLSEADTSTINLAAPVSDGAKVHIPTSEELSSGAQATSGDSGAGGAPTGAASAAPSLVNINTATPEELQGLSGVGEATAAAIIEDRQANGPFSSPEDLMRVSGIGEKKFAKIKAYICV